MSSLVGKQLGDYTLVGVLATGGMARIYEGVDRKLGRQAAVKVLELAQASDEEVEALMQRFQREARAVAQLEHDNIITIYQYGEQDGLYFIAMKLIRGRDLAQELARLRRNGMRMDVRRGLRILEQVAAALDCAHEAGIIHRDVKPSNILLDSTDRATLTDFGLVMQQTSIDSTLGTAFGTPRYIAPEQAISSGSAVAQSDTYSLAVVLYEILTGQTPFDGTTPMEIALSHINDPPPPPRSLNDAIPEAAEQEILKALDKEPSNRHASASDLIAAVKRAYDPEGVHDASTEASSKTSLMPDLSHEFESWDDPLPPPPRRYRRYNRPLLIGGAAAVVIVALLVVVAVVFASRALHSSLDLTPSPTAVVVLATVDTGRSTSLPIVAATPGPSPTASLTPTATLTPTTPPALLLLTYDDSSFNMINAGGADLDMTSIQFTRGTESFAGSRIPRGMLPLGNCFRLLVQGLHIERPAQCPDSTGQTFLSDAAQLFWRSEPDNVPTFSVVYGGNVLITCPTIARGGSSTCSVELPSLTGS